MNKSKSFFIAVESFAHVLVYYIIYGRKIALMLLDYEIHQLKKQYESLKYEKKRNESDKKTD
jgi:hypothetical protein